MCMCVCVNKMIDKDLYGSRHKMKVIIKTFFKSDYHFQYIKLVYMCINLFLISKVELNLFPENLSLNEMRRITTG